ncbi:type II toxin-antitoxin system PemK/MazF family toxin [Pseudobutyrivibrio ruminis]|uniref:type II toxin-antitoxin system PemK/MazF family toxin n=1 Tax=Pseudobutyrivibrio ruminis TaxID=46206 RepID=UPI00051BF47A|nr:type II toxin-antitoxin system PemK/MazF family toxin [Pseudobutyrivibrio ruminis]
MVEQGDIIKINGINHLALVISKDSYNKSGMAIVCPILQKSIGSTFEVEVSINDSLMYVASDSVRQLDLNIREYSTKGRVPYSKLIYIIDMAQSIIDYY